MLRFTRKQIVYLNSRNRERFVSQLVNHVGEQFGANPKDNPRLCRYADEAVDDALSFNMRTERAVSVYVTMALLLSHRIKEDPIVRRKLSSVVLDERAKTDFLLDWFEVFEAALRSDERPSDA